MDPMEQVRRIADDIACGHPVHCWESGEFLDHPGYTCLALNGHDGDHQWVINTDIVRHFGGKGGPS